MKKRLIFLLASIAVLIVVAFFAIKLLNDSAETGDSFSQQAALPVDSISAPASATASSSNPSSPDSTAGWNKHALPLDTFNATILLPEGLRINEGPDRERRLIVQDSPVVTESIAPFHDGTMYNGIRYIGMFDIGTDQELDTYQNANSESYVLTIMGQDETVSHSSSLETPYTYFYWEDYIVEYLPSPGIGGPYSRLGFIHLDTGLYLSFPFPPETPVLDVFDYYKTMVATVEFTG